MASPPLAAAALAAVPAAAAPARSADGGTLTVMTRNIFLGADLSPFAETRSPDEFLRTAGAIWSQIQANDFAHRARALAAEIAAAKPDLVGLQEVSLYRSDRPADGPITPAATVEQDYLRMLLKALKARGQHYRAAATFESGDLEIPVGLPPTMDIRATDRDSILVRAGAARAASGCARSSPVRTTPAAPSRSEARRCARRAAGSRRRSRYAAHGSSSSTRTSTRSTRRCARRKGKSCCARRGGEGAGRPARRLELGPRRGHDGLRRAARGRPP